MTRPIVEEDLFQELRDTEARVRQLEESLRNVSGAGGVSLNLQIAPAGNNGWITLPAQGVSSANTVYTNAALTTPLAITYTPTVNAWWDVHYAVAAVQRNLSSAGYWQPYLECSPAPVLGTAIGYGPTMRFPDSATFNWIGLSAHKHFLLTAGTAYTVTAKYISSGGPYAYFQASDQMFIEARAFPR